MELTKILWDIMGYSQLSKTSQNLADRYRHLQKTANIQSLLIQGAIQGQQSRKNETTPTAANNVFNTRETGVEREDLASSIDNYHHRTMDNNLQKTCWKHSTVSNPRLGILR